MYVDTPPDPCDPLHLLTMPPRHYATFYSNSAMVLWYLVRIEPFTSYHVSLQDGRFDRPDRQFHSVSEAFRGATTNDGDCKELIPELFYLRELYENTNECLCSRGVRRSVDLGCLQNSQTSLARVQLPPYARSPQHFIEILNRALESAYTSKHLHEWIDLVFGFKQVGIRSVVHSTERAAGCRGAQHLSPPAVHIARRGGAPASRAASRLPPARLHRRELRRVAATGTGRWCD